MMFSLSYQTLGNPGDSPLVFIHGLGAGRQQTTSAFPKLPGTYLIAPDMPGHGESQPEDDSNLSFDHFADLTVDLIRELGYQSVTLGGLSMGSGISLNIALRYPELVEKLILLRPSWLNRKQPDHLKLVAWVGQWIESLGAEQAKETLLACPEFQSLDQQNPPVAASIVALFQRPLTAASTAVLYRMWQDAPFEELNQLQNIKQSTLVLTTDRDELHPKSTANQIAAQLPNCRTDNLPARYHDGEAYAECLQSEVIAFLGR